MYTLQKKWLIPLITAIAITGLVISGYSAAAEPIIWKSSGHGPASDPSQIYHDKLCEAITKASGGRFVPVG